MQWLTSSRMLRLAQSAATWRSATGPATSALTAAKASVAPKEKFRRRRRAKRPLLRSVSQRANEVPVRSVMKPPTQRKQLPARPKAGLRKAMQQHIRTRAGAWKGKISGVRDFVVPLVKSANYLR